VQYPQPGPTQELCSPRLKEEFGLSGVVVGDRHLLTRVHREALDRHGYGWITALRAPRIRKLQRQGVVQLSLFDEENIAEIQDPDHPERRLIVCRNWQVATERRREA